MQKFTISADGFTKIRRQTLIRTIILMLLAVAIGFVISFNKTVDDVNVLPFVIPIALLAVGIGMFLGAKKQKLLLDSYTLTITNNMITREQLNTPTVSIYFSEVKEIIKDKNGAFLIKGKSANDLIIIPSQIDNHKELELMLNSILPVTVKVNNSFLDKFQNFAGLITLLLMLVVYMVNNKIIVFLSGTALISLLIWSIIKIRASKNVDNKKRRIIWWVVLVIISVVFVTINQILHR